MLRHYFHWCAERAVLVHSSCLPSRISGASFNMDSIIPAIQGQSCGLRLRSFWIERYADCMGRMQLFTFPLK